MAGLWEFPGGKIELGERPEETVVREMHEELGIIIQESCLSPFVFASHTYPEFHLLMPLFLCRRWEGSPIPRGPDIAWVDQGLGAIPRATIPMPAGRSAADPAAAGAPLNFTS